MTKQRKQYSKEFKLEMVKPIEEQNQRVVDIANKSVSMVLVRTLRTGL